MSGYEDFEAYEPAVPDEPYRSYEAMCVDCGSWVPLNVCPTCGLTDQDIADRLTRA